jgi:hypothetical protein
VASIETRGPKNAKRYFVKYDIGRTAEGKRVQRMHLLRGVEDMRQAHQELARVERELQASKDPFAVLRAPQAMLPRGSGTPSRAVAAKLQAANHRGSCAGCSGASTPACTPAARAAPSHRDGRGE